MNSVTLVEFIVAIATCMFLYSTIRPRPGLPGLLVCSSAIYFAIVTIFGLFAAVFEVRLFPQTVLIGFLPILVAAVLIVKYKGPAFSGICFERMELAVAVILFLSSFVIILYPSLPRMFPANVEVDAVSDYILTQYWLDHGLPATHRASYFSELIGVGHHPFGFHLNTAILANVFGIDTIFLLQPFNSFLIALAVLSVFGLSRELHLGGRTSCLVGAGMVLASMYPLEAVARGAYKAVMCTVLVMAFFWILKDYATNSRRATALLTLIQAAVVLTYPSWAIVTSLGALALAFRPKSVVQRMRLASILCIVFGGSAMASPELIGMWRDISWILFWGHSGATVPTLYSLGAIFFLASLGVLAILKTNKNPIVLSFVVSATLATLSWFGLMVYSGSGPYIFYKSFNLLVYPLGLVSAAGLEKLRSMIRPDLSLQRHTLRLSIKQLLSIGLVALLVIDFAGATYLGIGYYGDVRKIALNDEQYDVAVWVRENIANQQVDIAAHNPLPYWFLAITRKPPMTVMKDYPCSPVIDFNDWVSNARTGDVVVVYFTPYIPLDWRNALLMPQFTVLYQKGTNYVFLFERGNRSP